MTDDGLIVRHVRFCQCGKLAGHDSICNRDRSGRDGDEQVERIDRAAEELMAERNRLGHERDRRKLDSARRERRGYAKTLTLYREAMERAARQSTVKAGNTEPSRGGSEDNGPPRQQSLTDDPRWEDASRIIRRRVLQLLDLLDEAEGTGHAAAVAALDGLEKDQILLDEGRGLVAEQVVAELGPEYGSASYIRRLRRTRELDNRGYPKTDAPRAGQGPV